MNAVKEYFLSVSSTALFLSLVYAILPMCKVRDIAGFVGSLLFILVVITPISKLEAEDFAQAIAEINMQTQQTQSGVRVENREIIAQLIKQQCEAYILDKAEQIGIRASADITLSEGGEYPYPTSVILHGTVTSEEREYLCKMIEQDLGIPKERQEWR